MCLGGGGAAVLLHGSPYQLCVQGNTALPHTATPHHMHSTHQPPTTMCVRSPRSLDLIMKVSMAPRSKLFALRQRGRDGKEAAVRQGGLRGARDGML